MKHFILLLVVISSPSAFGGKTEEKIKKSRKVQEVSFSDMDLLGTVRNPEGAYLVQRRGIRFLPLYEVQKDFDARIRESDMYMK